MRRFSPTHGGRGAGSFAVFPPPPRLRRSRLAYSGLFSSKKVSEAATVASSRLKGVERKDRVQCFIQCTSVS